ncbi:MAG TPA: hemolysin family protein [Armatimonadota bacterium]|jgi:CBS domain containing-hemolysin-like protein
MSDDHILHTVLLLAATLALIALNGFFVATEFALIRVRSTRIKELEEHGNIAAKSISFALEHLDAYLSVTQLGITLASLGLGWIGEPAVAHGIVQPLFNLLGISAPVMVTTVSLVIAFVLITYGHIVLGELAPKWLVIQRAERVALWVAPPMRVIYLLFVPFVGILGGSARLLLRVVGIQPPSGHDQSHSEEELRMIISASATDQGGTLRDTQAELLDNVFDFGHRLARQIMIHRTEIALLDIEDSLATNVHIAQEVGHSRFPVIQGDIDTIIGFVHTKDLFPLYQRDPQANLRTILREMLLVPETIRVDLLLRQLQKNRQHMAVLVDEYGGTAGLVTIADLLEELVGDLPDEFEPAEEDWVIRLDEHTWSIDGRLPFSDLEEILSHELSCDEACDTVGGYAYWAFGRIPAANDTIIKDGISLRVLTMDGRRVSRVEISVTPSPAISVEAANTLSLPAGR